MVLSDFRSFSDWFVPVLFFLSVKNNKESYQKTKKQNKMEVYGANLQETMDL